MFVAYLVNGFYLNENLVLNVLSQVLETEPEQNMAGTKFESLAFSHYIVTSNNVMNIFMKAFISKRRIQSPAKHLKWSVLQK